MDLINKYKLPPNYRYMKVKERSYSSEDDYSSDFRISEIRDENSALEWVVSFQKSSKIIWNVARTHKVKKKYILFRKDFKCERHCNIQKFKSRKDTACPAVLKIKIDRYYDDGKYKPALDEAEEFPCLVEIYNHHNHPIKKSIPTIKESVKDELRRMFFSGHTASSADRTLNMQIFSIDDSEESSALLTLADIKYQFSEFRLLYGLKDRDCVHIGLKKFCLNYCASTSGKAAVFEDGPDIAIAICTPIMQKAACLLPQAKEVIFVDAPNSKCIKNHRIYFFVVPAMPGGAPIGCVITNSDKPSVFESGVKLLQSCLPAQADFVEDGPKYFLTNGDENDQSALSAIWPNTKFLLDHFHLLKAIWNWLCDTDHDIIMSARHDLFFAFEAVIYSDTEEEFNEKSECLSNMEVTLQNAQLQKYLTKFFSNKSSWASYLRENVSLKRGDTYIGSEIAFRIIRYSMLQKLKTHSLIQVMDCITVIYEKYLYNRYLDFESGKYIMSLINKFLVKKGRRKFEANVTYNDENKCFEVEGDQLYFVDRTSTFCTCRNSLLGYLCVHIVQVIKNFDVDLTFTINETNKEFISKVAELQHIDYTNCVAYQESENSVDDDISSMDELPCKVISDNSNPRSDITDKNDILKQLEDVFNRIKTGLNEKPEIFISATLQMIMNAQTFASTESGLISAMNNFGKYSSSNSSPIIERITVKSTVPDKITCEEEKPKFVVNKYEALKQFINARSSSITRNDSSHKVTDTSCALERTANG